MSKKRDHRGRWKPSRNYIRGFKAGQREGSAPSDIIVGHHTYRFGEYELNGAPKVIMSAEIYSKMLAFSRAGDTEIGGLARIEIEHGNLFRILDLECISQQVTYATTSLDSKGIAMFAMQWLSKDEDEKANSIRCWWHSHNSMPVFWSPTDRDTQDITFGRVAPYSVAVVINHKGEMRASINLYQPVRITFDKSPIIIEERKPEEKFWKAEEILPTCMRLARGFIPFGKKRPVFIDGPIYEKILQNRQKRVRMNRLDEPLFPANSIFSADPDGTVKIIYKK